jgi:hypothetical protein
MAALPNIGSVSWKAVTLVLPAVPQGGCHNPREINTFAPSEAQALPLVKHRPELGS